MQNNGLYGYDYGFRATILHTFGVWVGLRVSGLDFKLGLLMDCKERVRLLQTAETFRICADLLGFWDCAIITVESCSCYASASRYGWWCRVDAELYLNLPKVCRIMAFWLVLRVWGHYFPCFWGKP